MGSAFFLFFILERLCLVLFFNLVASKYENPRLKRLVLTRQLGAFSGQAPKYAFFGKDLLTRLTATMHSELFERYTD